MKSNQLVICDSEAGYAGKLADYLRGKETYGYEIRTFTNAAGFMEHEVQNAIGILLIEDRLYQGLLLENKLEQLEIKRVLLLTKDRQAGVEPKEETVYKYQPGYGIFCRLFKEQELMPALCGVQLRKSRATVTGVYSPVKRTLKTAFAITLGQLLSEREEVLYMDLEGCSGLLKLLSLQPEKNLTDLAYEFSINGHLPAPLHPYIQMAEGLSVMAPAASISELQCVTEEEWLALLGAVAAESGYQSILLDIGDNVCGIMEILRLCDRIYMPCRSDHVSKAKLEAFTASMEKHVEAASFQEKIHRLEFPYFEDLGEGFMNLKYTGLGTYVRRLLSLEEL
ncbi:MAG: hypothetical protein QM697_02040 [Lachnospiraceae bacterium]